MNAMHRLRPVATDGQARGGARARRRGTSPSCGTGTRARRGAPSPAWWNRQPGDLVLVGAGGGRRPSSSPCWNGAATAPMRLALPDGATIASPRRAAATSTPARWSTARRRDGRSRRGTLDVSAARTDARLGRVSRCWPRRSRPSPAHRRPLPPQLSASSRKASTLRARDIDQRASGHMHLRGDAVTLQGSALVEAATATRSTWAEGSARCSPIAR